MTKRLLFTALALAAAAAGQSARFSATTGDVVLNAAGTKFTIQQPAAGGKTVRLESAVIYCSVACDATQAHSGTAATATAGTVSKLPPAGPGANAAVYTASDVGSGTAVGGILHIAAAATVVLDLSQVTVPRGSNYTVIISSITGTANVTLFWSEQ